MTRFLTIMSDGSSKGNRAWSPASIGAVIKNEHGDVVDRISEQIPNTDAHHAEYTAMLSALRRAKQEHGATHVIALTDSLDMARHINAVPNPFMKHPPASLVHLANEIKKEAQDLDFFHIAHVFREFNTEADSAANAAYRVAKEHELLQNALA